MKLTDKFSERTTMIWIAICFAGVLYILYRAELVIGSWSKCGYWDGKGTYDPVAAKARADERDRRWAEKIHNRELRGEK